MSNLPSWTITKPHIDLTLIQQEKTQPTTSSAKNKFNELRDNCSDHSAFYSNRSKTIDGTGAAATNMNNYQQIRLPNNGSIYSAELQAIKMALDMIKNSEMGKSIIFSNSLSSRVAIQEENQNHPYMQEIRKTYHYLTNFGKTVILAWVPNDVSIKGNQMVDILAKEATKMITTLRLSFTKLQNYKTKIKYYIRKWQTIWDMSPNNKLNEHQPTIKLEIAEPLPNQRQDIILSRIRIGHACLMHAYLLKEETVPWCTCCNQPLTVSHILIGCKKYENIREKSYWATTLDTIQRCTWLSNNIVPKKNKLLPTVSAWNWFDHVLPLSELCWSKLCYP